MASDTGIMKFDKTGIGRWITDVKDGRSRHLCIIGNDNPGTKDDHSYVGYYHDVNKTTGGCNLAISFSGEAIDIQVIKPGSNDVKFISLTPGEFFDKLETFFFPAIAAMAK